MPCTATRTHQLYHHQLYSIRMRVAASSDKAMPSPVASRAAQNCTFSPCGARNNVLGSNILINIVTMRSMALFFPGDARANRFSVGLGVVWWGVKPSNHTPPKPNQAVPTPRMRPQIALQRKVIDIVNQSITQLLKVILEFKFNCEYRAGGSNP